MPAPFSWPALSKPWVMGILNATPDSFSDGGAHADPVAAGLRMVEQGADLLDIGGESTRPGATPVSPDEEIRRILPVIKGLRGVVPLSVDTRYASTMEAAVAAGATLINDVSALAFDPAAADLAARLGCPVILMHMRGTPVTMSGLARYADVVAEVQAELGRSIDAAVAAGVDRARIAIDPGFGFAKNHGHNIALLRNLINLESLGCPIVAGVSRKRFVGALSGVAEASKRQAGSVAAALFAWTRGASILRVHDVAETVQALRVWQGLLG